MKTVLSLFAAAAVACFPAAASAQLTTEVVATGLARPVWVTHAPGDFERVFVIEQRSGSLGRIRVLDITTDTLLPTPFLSVSVDTGNEQGLLGLAFHPDYASNGKFYINYTDPSGTTFVDEYQVSASDPNVADASSRKQVLSIAQPFSNHNAGWIAFGPNDGYLYISTGDGGSGGDPGNRSQDITNQLLGKMLRVDVDGDDFPADNGRNYAVPADNPFVGVTGDDEIWAYGLRNAWRCDFDDVTGDLYMADVGQNAREEINFQPASSTGGENYGWRCYEGNQAFNTSGCPAPGDLTFPVQDYSHALGCSVTGGIVYRGCALPEIDGAYFYADYCSGTLWSFRYDGSTLTDFTNRTAEIGGGFGIASFGEDAYGEMYICRSSTIERVVRDGAPLNDCDGNGVEDDCQIAAGDTPPCVCPADTNLDGLLSPADFNAWIANYNAGCD